MKYLSMQRNPDEVFKQLEVQDDESVLCKTEMTVVFPKRYLDRDMASIGDDVRSVGVMMIATPTHWCLYSVCAMVSMKPDAIEYFNYQGQDYVELKFEKGSKLFNSIYVVQQDIIVYHVYKEFLSNGNIPFFVQVNHQYDDTAGLLDTAGEYAGTEIGSQREVTELIASLSPRNPDNLIEYFRQLPPEIQAKTRPNFVGMISAPFGATNTLSRTAGAYFDQGLIAAMIYPSEEVTRQETLVRG